MTRRDPRTVMAVMSDAAEGGADLRLFADELIVHLRALLLLRTGADARLTDELPADEVAWLRERAPAWSVGVLMQLVQTLSDALARTRDAAQFQVQTEVALLTACDVERPAAGCRSARPAPARRTDRQRRGPRWSPSRGHRRQPWSQCQPCTAESGRQLAPGHRSCAPAPSSCAVAASAACRRRCRAAQRAGPTSSTRSSAATACSPHRSAAPTRWRSTTRPGRRLRHRVQPQERRKNHQPPAHRDGLRARLRHRLSPALHGRDARPRAARACSTIPSSTSPQRTFGGQPKRVADGRTL